MELRATTRLAQLYQRQERHDDVRELLEPIYEWFTQGFDTSDLNETKALLDQFS